MNNTKLTVFHPKNTKNKNPWSPFDDNTFIFETYEPRNNLEMYAAMVSHFILNIPINISKPIRTFRRKANLEQYYSKKINYIILDIDDVTSEFNKQKVLDYFKDYKVVIGESRSYNGIDNFNMKGVLFTEEIEISDIKLAISSIHHDLKDVCTFDESVGRKASLNAPMLKNNVFLNNEDGILFKFVKQEALEVIDNIKKEYVEHISKGGDIDVKDLADIEADTMEKLCLKVFQMMQFTAIKNNPNGSISFKHPDEKKTPGGYFWFSSSPYTMHHGNSTKSINIFDTVRKLPQAKELMKREINYDDEFLNFNTDTNVVQVDQKYLEVTDEVKETVETYLNNKNGLLSIRSPMGTGKSTLIQYIIDECHELDMKVLIVTNRISVAQDFGKKYGIKVYNQDKYNLGDSLICQYDSLWRYNVKFFDIVIMDEFISIMTHSRSNLNNNSINIAKFFGCFNKKLVIADAFLSGYENFLLSNKTSNVHLIDNVYRDPTTLYCYEDFNYFVQSIIVHTERHKVSVSATSLSFINALQLLLQKRGLKVVTLTAETPESTKKLIYELFDKEEHDKWDVIIYSPTLTVGVSNINKCHYHFHYDSSISTDVISSIQMIKRTRKAKEIHMFIKERINYLKTSYNDIRDEYMGNIGKKMDQNYLFEIDNYGEPKLSEIGKKAIKIDTFKNILEFDHKKAMMWLLKYHFRNDPRIIEESFNGNVLMRYQKMIKSDHQAIVRGNIDQFLELNEIQKTGLLMDSDADKTLRIIAETYSEIKDVEMLPSVVKTQILEEAVNDPSFIQKCKYYRAAFNFTKGIWESSDIRQFISRAVLDGENSDLQFYNALLKYGQKEIFKEYDVKIINRNKPLKYILDRCGYKADTSNNFTTVGKRFYRVNKKIQDLYGYIQ